LVDVIGEQFCAAVSTAATLWVLFISGIPLLLMPDGMRHDRDLWIARGLAFLIGHFQSTRAVNCHHLNEGAVELICRR